MGTSHTYESKHPSITSKLISRLRTLASSCVLAIACSACATAPLQSGSSEEPCSHLGAAVIGTAIGAAAGATLGGARGALAGGAIGGVTGALACEIYISYQSQQVRSPQQTNASYVQAYNANLPALEVLSYETRITPGKRVEPGRRMGVNSVIEVAGTNNAQLAEEIALFDGNNQFVGAHRKNVNSLAGHTGKYSSKFTLSLPENMPQGKYRLDTTLYVNNEIHSQNSQDVWVR